MGIGEEGDVIVAVPGDSFNFPGAGEAAELGGGFEEGDALTGQGETVGECHAEDSTAEDCVVGG
jgi:hypothetical protein